MVGYVSCVALADVDLIFAALAFGSVVGYYVATQGRRITQFAGIFLLVFP